MHATLLDEHEGEPASRPAVWAYQRPGVGSWEDGRVDPALAWARLEAWIRRRWAARPVTWIASGPGEFTPPLEPFRVSTVERWADGAWIAETPAASPLGWSLDAATYRIAGTAGDDTDPPAAVAEAYRRLLEFHRGVSLQFADSAADYVTDASRRPAGWAAKAIHLSGAADLLRPWKRT
ncbi:MAG: hypothetical protein ACLFTG_08420 [Alphaproteobacteria bacterium]